MYIFNRVSKNKYFSFFRDVAEQRRGNKFKIEIKT